MILYQQVELATYLVKLSDWGIYKCTLVQTQPSTTDRSVMTRLTGSACMNRDRKIVVYGKRQTSDTLLAIKTKSLTVKYITYRIYSKCRKLRIKTPCLTTELGD